MEAQQYVVLVPVKSPAVGKSRLRVADHVRPALARGFALDALHAARRTPGVVEVVVVTPDSRFAEVGRGLGFRSLPDSGDLNHSLAAAAFTVRAWFPAAVPVALCADLPCLTPEDLAQSLAQVTGGGAWFVADAHGTGTSMYAAPYAAFAPRFGAGSRAAHRAGGATEVVGALHTLRLDVDDEDDLAAALALGAGPHTREALSAVGP